MKAGLTVCDVTTVGSVFLVDSIRIKCNLIA